MIDRASQGDMRVVFDSSHVYGSFPSGRLTVRVGTEDRRRGQTVWDELFFEVPADFHAHNDAVAAALMTLVGTHYDEVEFNFPISTQCAEILGRFYENVEVGPVDPSAAPRRPGTKVALNFSGGMDSAGTWLLLRELYGDDFLVITSEYGGFSEFERVGYGGYRRDVSCKTNFRRKRYDQNGRFNFCVPLLFADYLDLSSMVTGHSMTHETQGLEDYRDGRPPSFLGGDLVLNAGGVNDIHLMRPLCPVGTARIFMALGPEGIEAALAASSPQASGKPYTGALIFRLLYEEAGLPVPQFLLDYRLRRRMEGNTLRVLYLIKRIGYEETVAFAPAFRDYDLRFLDDLTMNFMERYNPVNAATLPQPLRDRAIELYHRCGIAPYEDRDWAELAAIRRFLKANVATYEVLEG